MTKARRLTDEGIIKAVEFLDIVRADPQVMLAVSERLLFDDATSEYMPNAPEVKHCKFVTRRDAAEYIDSFEPALDEQFIDDWAFWSWLGMYHFHDIIFNEERLNRFTASTRGRGPTTKGTIVAALKSPQKIRDSSRHYLRSSWLINRRYRDQGAILLEQDIMTFPTITVFILDSQRVFNSVGVVSLLLDLYTENNEQKRGLSATKPGNIYRLFHVLEQLECTYDIYGMSSEALMDILPPEFDQWKP